MKEINLLSLVQAFNTLSAQLLGSYLQHHHIKIKNDEFIDLISLVNILNLQKQEIVIFNNFFVGYNIPQISKEFDLLRFGKNFNINIELKSKSTPEKITKQLTRNQYYLDFLVQNTHCYTYVTNEQTLYTLDDSQNLQQFSLQDLAQVLMNQEEQQIAEIDELFNPSNYLVSPFNSTEAFISDKYFLTAQQEEIKKSALQKTENDNEVFLSVCGKAGTGKTLLTYDIAKEFISDEKEVLVFHCGNLNEGHNILKDKYGWNISSIKYFMSYNFHKYSLIIIDETQRIYPNQLKTIIEQIKRTKGKCIFSYDSQQWLRKQEFMNNIETKIQNQAPSIKFELTEKIRTNREIASFTKCLFNKNLIVPKLKRSNIELTYFDNYDEARHYLNYLKTSGWKVINYTQSSYDTHPYEKFALLNEENSHSVIGQEFDKVVAVIDSHFYYYGNDLSTRRYRKKPYYHPTQMLFQNITRTRRKLHLLVVNNQEIMERSMEIFSAN